ncbi:MAG: hypothetical protein LBG77_01775 [Dysgonamonadaceae bacterium]|jgi:hypothetical protein|nr:hypothetical protein [Dysgonamonadaceae bacterium]
MQKEVIIEVKDGDEVVGTVKFKRPDSTVLSAVNKLQKTDEVRAIDMFVAQCCIEGADIINSDGLLKTQIGGAALEKMLKQFSLEVKN